MATLNLQCSASDHDCNEWTPIGVQFPTFSINDFGERIFAMHCGLYFSGVSGLSGATITAATLTFRAGFTSLGVFVGDWYAEDSASPGVFDGSSFDISTRTRTTATCEGDDVDFGSTEGAWITGSDYTFPAAGSDASLIPIIQELADSYDPSAIVLLWIYTSGNGECSAVSYDGDSANAPKLTITYTTAGGDATLTCAGAVAAAADAPDATNFTADSEMAAGAAVALAESPVAAMTGTAAGTLQADLAVAIADSPDSSITADASMTAGRAAPAVAEVLAATMDAIDITWQAFDETQFQIVRSDFPTNATFYLEIVMTTTSAANTVKARLYNVTDSTKVTGSEVSSVATSGEPSLSGAFDFPAGTKTYRLEGGGDTGGSYTWNVAKILVDW